MEIMQTTLKGKVALVTGAGGGIGGAVSELLAEKGVRVAMTDIKREPLEELCQTIKQKGGQAMCRPTDVTKRELVKEYVNIIHNTWGPVDILVNCAGVINATPLRKGVIDEWTDTVNINVKGMLNCIWATLGPMVERRTGHIVNMSSIGGKFALDFLCAAPYYGSKFFIQGFSSGMRQELAKKGVKVSCVCPGHVMTEIYLTNKDPEANNLPKIQAMREGVNPLDLALYPMDIAQSIYYILDNPYRVAVNEVTVESAPTSML